MNVDEAAPSPSRRKAYVSIGIAGIRGTYEAQIELADLKQPDSLRLCGNGRGALGFGEGEAIVRLTAAEDGRTQLRYSWSADAGGKVAAVGQRMLQSVTKTLIAQFFGGLERRLAGSGGKQASSWWRRLFNRLKGGS